MANQTIIFLHIPKAAGTTLRYILEREYGHENVHHLTPPIGEDDLRAVEEKSRSANRRVITGHFPYGVHEIFGDSSRYFTILREPVDRVISHYYFVLQQKDHYLYEKVAGTKMSLEDYVASDLTTEIDNGQLRMLAGHRWKGREIAIGSVTAELQEEVRQNIKRHFDFVGFSDRFDETALGLQKFYGWKTPNYTSVNVTKKRASAQDVPDSVKQIVRERNRLEIELYEAERAKFNERWDQHLVENEVNLEKFRRANKRFNMVRNFGRRLLGKS